MKLKTLGDLEGLAVKTASITRNGKQVEIDLLPIMAKDYESVRDHLIEPVPPFKEGEGGVRELDFRNPDYLVESNRYQTHVAYVLVCLALGDEMLGAGTLQEQMDRMTEAFTQREIDSLAEQVAESVTGPSEAQIEEAKGGVAPLG